MNPSPEEVETGWKIGGVIAAVLTGIGVARWGNKSNSEKLRDHDKRIAELEETKRDSGDCEKLRMACPVAVKLIAVEKQSDGLTDWLKRIEAKLDRLIEKG